MLGLQLGNGPAAVLRGSVLEQFLPLRQAVDVLMLHQILVEVLTIGVSLLIDRIPNFLESIAHPPAAPVRLVLVQHRIGGVVGGPRKMRLRLDVRNPKFLPSLHEARLLVRKVYLKVCPQRLRFLSLRLFRYRYLPKDFRSVGFQRIPYIPLIASRISSSVSQRLISSVSSSAFASAAS